MGSGNSKSNSAVVGSGNSKAVVAGSGNSASAASLTTGASINDNPRQFPVPGTESFASLPSYFGPATADVNWQTMKTMAKYKLDWSTSDAQALLKGGPS